MITLKYFDVTIVAENNGSALGDKITANGAKYGIKLDGQIVGSLVFNKNNPTIKIIITSDVSVDILWNCASKYATTTINGAGTYTIPQLVQNNGKLQSFNALWITSVKPGGGTPGTYQNISVHDAKQMMTSTSNIVLLDVRNQSEYDLGHLYNAELIPLYALENSTIPFEIEPPTTDDTLTLGVYQQMVNSFHLSVHTDDPVIVYCKAGSTSASACKLLAEQGYTQVYNVMGGITEWMQADYPTFTPMHHVNVDIVNGKTTTNIQPWLLYIENCDPCQSLLEIDSIITSHPTITETIIEQTENYTLTLTTLDIDGNTLEAQTNRTMLWRQDENTSNFNKTTSLSSSITTSQDKTIWAYDLFVQLQHTDYVITINTYLTVLDESTYNQSVTFMEYIPTGSKPFATIEIIEFITPVTLSQLLQSLAQTTFDLGDVYALSEAASLRVFADRYYTLATETQLLAQIVETQLSSYDKPILLNVAVIEDGPVGYWCGIACPIVVIVGCMIACVWNAAVCLFCWEYSAFIDLGCTILCEAISLFEDTGSNPRNLPSSAGKPTPYWISSVTSATWHGSSACGVWNANGICKAYSDNSFAQIYAGNYGDQAMIMGVMSGTAKGDIWLYGYSAPGYYSDYQVWISTNGVTWTSVYSSWISGSSSPQYIYGGYTSSSFNYMAVVCYNTGYSCNLFIDCVTSST